MEEGGIHSAVAAHAERSDGSGKAGRRPRTLAQGRRDAAEGGFTGQMTLECALTSDRGFHVKTELAVLRQKDSVSTRELSCGSRSVVAGAASHGTGGKDRRGRAARAPEGLGSSPAPRPPWNFSRDTAHRASAFSIYENAGSTSVELCPALVIHGSSF